MRLRPHQSVCLRSARSHCGAETVEIHRPDVVCLPRLPAVIGPEADLAQRGRLPLREAGRGASGPEFLSTDRPRRAPGSTHGAENSTALTRQNGACYPHPSQYANMAYPDTKAMVRPRRISEPVIRGVLADTKGNILQAARRLGIHRNALYRRLELLDIDPDLFRANAASLQQDATPDTARASRSVRAAAQPASAHSAERAPVRTLSLVSSLEAAPKRDRARRTLWVRREHLAALAKARRHIAAALDVDLTDSSLLERFIEEAFGPWVTKQLKVRAHARPEEKP
jgi:hypothetical protein